MDLFKKKYTPQRECGLSQKVREDLEIGYGEFLLAG